MRMASSSPDSIRRLGGFARWAVGAIGSGLPAVFGSRLSILIFHRVHAETDALFPSEPDANRFRELMQFLCSCFRFVSLDEAVQALREGRLRPGTVVVSFDDGYRDNLEVACPILSELGIPAAFFVATGFMAGGLMWNDRLIESIRGAPGGERELSRELARILAEPKLATGQPVSRRDLCLRSLAAVKYLPPAEREQAVGRIQSALGAAPGSLMMDPEQVRRLRDYGMTVGGHTINHPILSGLAEDEARHEIAGGKRALESVLGETVRYFAYPNGKPGVDYSARDVGLVREAGFEAAVSTEWGVAGPCADLHQLPRFTPWDRDPARFGLRLALDLRRRDYARA